MKNVNKFVGSGFLAVSLTGTLMGVWSGCGKQSDTSSDKIVGGTAVRANELIGKSTVALVDNATHKVFCSGTLIGPQTVLTAAHCVVGAKKANVTMAVSFGHITAEAKSTIAVSSAIAHEGFNAQAMGLGLRTSAHSQSMSNDMLLGVTDKAPNDIAILKLAQSAPATALAMAPLTEAHQIKVGDDLVLVGFGITAPDTMNGVGTLRKGLSKIIALDAPRKEFEFGGVPGVSACSGDSGGPAFVSVKGKMALVGVTSRGHSQCDEKGIYTDVRYFSSWIDSHK